MISDIQTKFATSNFNEEISLLTLLPSEWNFLKVNMYFKYTYYMFIEARRLKLIGIYTFNSFIDFSTHNSFHQHLYIAIQVIKGVRHL